MPNFLHHFDEANLCRPAPQGTGRLGAGRAARHLGIRTHEDRVSPPREAMFSYIMLATTQAGTAFPASALERMLTQAGFHQTKFVPLPPSPQTLIVAEPA